MQVYRRQQNRLLPLFLSILMLMLAPALKATNQPQTVTLITDNSYEPYSYTDNGDIKGITVELIRKVDAAIPDYTIKLAAMPWREGLNLVREGRALGIIGTYFSGPHRPEIYPYSQPLLSEQVVVMCRPDVKLASPASWPDSFTGLLMLNIAGYDGWLDFDIRNKRHTQLINFLEVPTVATAYTMLKKGNADCSLTEQKFAEMTIAAESSDNKNTPVIVAPVSVNPIHIGYSAAGIQNGSYPFAYDFARAFDMALYQIKHQNE